jgi:hypothetical protein
MRMSSEYHGRGRRLSIMLGLLGVVALASLAAAAPAGNPGVRPGEAMTFRLYMGGLEAGRARMSVGMPVSREGRRLVAVHGQAETTSIIKLVARMDEDYQLVLDANTLLPREVVSLERSPHPQRIASLVDGQHVAHDVKTDRYTGKSKRVMPSLVRDPLTALFALRAMPLADGEHLQLDVLDGTVLWRSQLAIRREQVRLSDETHGRPAIRIDGEITRIDDAGRPLGQPPRHLTVWLSDDADRALLRMESDTSMGRAAIELTSYQRGTRGPMPQLPGITRR